MGGRCDERRVSTSLSIPPRKVRCAEQRMREPGAPVSASSAFVPFLLRAPVPKKTGRCQRGVKILSTCHFFDLSFLLTGVEAAMLVNRGRGAPSRLISSVVPPPHVVRRDLQAAPSCPILPSSSSTDAGEGLRPHPLCRQGPPPPSPGNGSDHRPRRPRSIRWSTPPRSSCRGTPPSLRGTPPRSIRRCSPSAE